MPKVNKYQIMKLKNLFRDKIFSDSMVEGETYFVVQTNSTIRKVSFEKLNLSKLSKEYVVTYIRSVVPKFQPDLSSYDELLAKDIGITNYFKRIYPFVKFSNLEHFLSRSKHYDAKFIKKIEKQVLDTKAQFFSKLESAKQNFINDYRPKISSKEHLECMKEMYNTFYGGTVIHARPEPMSVLEQMNLDASVGLPTPWIKKRSVRDAIFVVLGKIHSGQLNLIEMVKDSSKYIPYTAAFIRNQITDSGLKTRLVFAVSTLFVTVESYFNAISKEHLSLVGGRAIHGYTQSEISNLTRKSKMAYTICLDYKEFDQRISSFVAMSVFMLDIQAMLLSPYLYKLYLHSFCYFLVSPVFHPMFKTTMKKCGLNSGSGYTSLFGSKCNYYMLTAGIRKYNRKYNQKVSSDDYVILVSSDDTIILSSYYIDYNKLILILEDTFSVKLTLEKYTPIGEDTTLFLGSTWKEGKPYRNINRMFGRILFGSGNYPKMSDYELFSSRCHEILGNTCQYSEIYETFGLPYPKRVFRFRELADYSQQQVIKLRSGFDKRGYFQDVVVNRSNANLVWTTR